MPVQVQCDECGVVAEALTGWFQTEVVDYSLVDIPAPNTRVLVSTPYVLYFHAEACRDAWRTARTIPLVVPPPAMRTAPPDELL
jgi:hypothetical protein